jgi:hypothetical protein
VFMPIQRNSYPAHQTSLQLEDRAHEWFQQNPVRTKRNYLPIRWTAYQVNNREKSKEMDRLSRYCEWLGSMGRKFFTVVQHDDGVLGLRKDQPHANTLVFGAGGYGVHPIPLVCDEHPVRGLSKKYLFSFVGNIKNHPIRERMRDALSGIGTGLFVPSVPARDRVRVFEEVTEQSYFTLCPRGYGKTSYRFYEALQLGSIPIYISDEHWLPFFDKSWYDQFCIVGGEALLPKLVSIMDGIFHSGLYGKMRQMAMNSYHQFFKYEACFDRIKRILEDEHERIS